MKKCLLGILVVLAIALTACGQSGVPAGQQPVADDHMKGQQQISETSKTANSGTVTQQGAAASNAEGKKTNITLTVGDIVIRAYLNNTSAAQDLISRLPVKVKLFDSDNDYCGDITPPLVYRADEVQAGYKNGDLAFWTAGNDFVIFIDQEEQSANTGNLVIIGKVTSGLEKIHALGKSISYDCLGGIRRRLQHPKLVNTTNSSTYSNSCSAIE